MELEYLGVLFWYGAERGEHYLPSFSAAGEEELVLGVEEAESGELEVGRGLDGLVEILGVDVEDVDVVVEEQKSK